MSVVHVLTGQRHCFRAAMWPTSTESAALSGALQSFSHQRHCVFLLHSHILFQPHIVCKSSCCVRPPQYFIHATKRFCSTHTIEFCGSVPSACKQWLSMCCSASQRPRLQQRCTLIKVDTDAWLKLMLDALVGCRYAAGATIQILLFGCLAIEIKRKAPTAHTMLEIIRARWGTLAHIVSVACLSQLEESVSEASRPSASSLDLDMHGYVSLLIFSCSS